MCSADEASTLELYAFQPALQAFSERCTVATTSGNSLKDICRTNNVDTMQQQPLAAPFATAELTAGAPAPAAPLATALPSRLDERTAAVATDARSLDVQALAAAEMDLTFHATTAAAMLTAATAGGTSTALDGVRGRSRLPPSDSASTDLDSQCITNEEAEAAAEADEDEDEDEDEEEDEDEQLEAAACSNAHSLQSTESGFALDPTLYLASERLEMQPGAEEVPVADAEIETMHETIQHGLHRCMQILKAAADILKVRS